MSNVVSLRDTQYGRASRLPCPPETFDSDIAGLACRVTGLRSKAQEEICHSILMPDRAAQHARRIAERICDPAVKKNFDASIATIEQLLGIARDKALKL